MLGRWFTVHANAGHFPNACAPTQPTQPTTKTTLPTRTLIVFSFHCFWTGKAVYPRHNLFLIIH
jgi:hypothetical protein